MVREGLTPDQAHDRFHALAIQGLLLADDPRLLDFQKPYAREAREVSGWSMSGDRIDLLTVVQNVHPTVLIGTSTQTGAFDEKVVREMAAHTARPIILPLSNPTSRSEADPSDLIVWTEGRALTATGSPYPPVIYEDVTYDIAQSNNALVFPGLGLGVAVARASRITDGMVSAAAHAVAKLSDASRPGTRLLPPMSALRSASAAVAVAVAEAAVADGVNQAQVASPIQQVHDAMWLPDYPELEIVGD